MNDTTPSPSASERAERALKTTWPNLLRDAIVAEITDAEQAAREDEPFVYVICQTQKVRRLIVAPEHQEGQVQATLKDGEYIDAEYTLTGYLSKTFLWPVEWFCLYKETE